MQFLSGPVRAVDSITLSQDLELGSEVVAIYPMTKAQEGLWLEYSTTPHHTQYNLTLKFTFSRSSDEYDGSLDAIQAGTDVICSAGGNLLELFLRH